MTGQGGIAAVLYDIGALVGLTRSDMDGLPADVRDKLNAYAATESLRVRLSISPSEATERLAARPDGSPQASATPQAQPDTAAEEHIYARRPQGNEAQQWIIPASAGLIALHLSRFRVSAADAVPCEDLLITVETLSQARSRGAVESGGAA